MVKKLFKRYLVDAMSSMALGLFASLIIGLILSQIAKLAPLGFLKPISEVLGASSPVVGAAIGVAIAYGLKAAPLTLFSSAATGALGYKLAGPLGAYFAAVVGAELGRLVAGRTKLDILVVPGLVVLAGGLTAYLLAAPINLLTSALQDFLENATTYRPVPMGIIIAVVFGIVLTAPISSAALAAVVFAQEGGAPLGEGLLLAAGAATTGCCCHMVGFAVASFRENGVSGLISQGLGTSMLQFGNALAHPLIWIPPTLASAILGPLSTTVFKMWNASAAAGMGTSGIVGQIGTFAAMSDQGALIVLGKILIIQIILPAILSLAFSEIMRKMGLIKYGDMKLTL